ncbi:hypothetical protein Tco_1247838 [Tanacetum coccineum]
MATNEETNAAGTDTRPPMLVEDDYDSWKIRIQRYIRGKPNGKLIWKSIQNGPTPHPMVTDPPPTGSTIVPGPRKKLDSEFNDEENKLEMADTQAEIILSQGLPRHIFNILNQTSTAKEIWDNVEMLMQGSAPTPADLLPPRKRFRDLYLPEDSEEEHIKVDIADAEAVADVGISEGVVAHLEDGVRMGFEIAASDVREDDEYSESSRGGIPDLEDTIYDIFHYMSEVRIDRITEIETTQRQLV